MYIISCICFFFLKKNINNVNLFSYIDVLELLDYDCILVLIYFLPHSYK